MEFDRWMKLVALERECDEIAEELLKTMGRAQAVLMDINRLLKQDSEQLTARCLMKWVGYNRPTD